MAFECSFSMDRPCTLDLERDVLSDADVRHVFSVKDGLIKSMDLRVEEAGSSSGPSALFAKH